MKTLSFILLFILCSCSFTEEPLKFVSYNGFEMKQVNGKQMDFNVKLTVENKLFFPIKFKPSQFDFGLDDQQFGKLSFDEKIKLKPNKTTQIVLPVHLALEDGKFIQLMSYTQKDAANFQLNGTIHTKFLFFPKDVNLNISKPFSPKSFNPFTSNYSF